MLVLATQDADFFSQLADGDDQALAEIFDRYAPAILALLQAMLGPTHEAEEQLHDLFLQLWRAAPSWGLSPPPSLCTWLMLRARERALVLLAQDAEPMGQGQSSQLLPAGWRPPSRFDLAWMSDPYLGRERTKVRRALLRLGATARRLLGQVYLQGSTARQLACAGQAATRPISRRLAFALQNLHRLLHADAQSPGPETML